MDIRHIAVIGAGTMGSGSAPLCATYGYTVTLRDIVLEQLERAQRAIHQSVEKLHAGGRITDAQRDAALGGIRTSLQMADVADTDLVVEAVVERLEVRGSLSATGSPDPTGDHPGQQYLYPTGRGHPSAR